MAGGDDPLIQYIIVREDLWKEQGWSLGSVMAQGCHAAVAAVWESKGAATTGAYCSPANIDSMRKVVLQVPNEAQLLKITKSLEMAGIAHKVWIEQPEAIPTCIATTPQLKSVVGPALKRLALCKRPLYMDKGAHRKDIRGGAHYMLKSLEQCTQRSHGQIKVYTSVSC